MHTCSYDISSIQVPETHRPLDERTVLALMESIRELGLFHPIVVEADQGEVLLVAGRHRLEACRRLGEMKIEAVNVYSMIIEEDPGETAVLRPIVELEENLCRLNVKDRRTAMRRLGQAKKRLAKYRAARAAEQVEMEQTGQEADNIATQCRENGGHETKLSRKQRTRPGSSRGRPRNAVTDELAQKTGLSKRSAERAMEEPKTAPGQTQNPAPQQSEGLAKRSETEKPKASKLKTIPLLQEPTQDHRLKRFQDDYLGSRVVKQAFANFFELDESHQRLAAAWHRSGQ
jgi:ParB-like chromosome segregation protein Spo0J